MSRFLEKLIAAEEKETNITINTHCLGMFTIRLEFVPMDVTVIDNQIEFFDSDKGEYSKIIISMDCLRYENGIYRVVSDGGYMDIEFGNDDEFNV